LNVFWRTQPHSSVTGYISESNWCNTSFLSIILHVYIKSLFVLLHNYTGQTIIGPCKSNPCLNGGTCTKENNRYMCSCSDDYSGQTCEDKYLFHLIRHANTNSFDEDKLIHAVGSFLTIMMYVVAPVYRNMCSHLNRLCAVDCEDQDIDGIYISCEDCQKYFVCNGSSHTRHTCPHKPNWGFNVDTKQCQYGSPHCVVCSGRY